MITLIDHLVNCLHWFDMFIPGRKDHIDWKHVGQMRSRLVRMRFGDKTTSVSQEVKTETSGSMLVNFRAMNGKIRDRQALSRWYGKENAKSMETELSARIEATRRAQEARLTSGHYPAITAEDAEAIYEGQQQQQMSKAAEDKLASFLAGTTDDINEILFTSIGDMQANAETVAAATVEVETERASNGLASKFSRLKRASKADQTDEVSQNAEVIAALEETHKLGSSQSATETMELELEPVTMPIEAFLEAESSTSDDDSDGNCTSMAAARSRKAASLKSRSLR